MDILIIAVLAFIAAETSYLIYKTVPKNKIEKHSLLLDTSVLIDGRILPIARSGLITAPLIVPRSVVRELQYMADKADHDKRERAREGLDMIDQLQRIESLNITTIDDKSLESGVDERLVELAKEYDASLCTIDYNLNKSARAQGVDVVNINELAHALRIVHLPGESVEIKLVQAGQGAGQAVGYLDDGTMVVVDDAKSSIGQTVQAEVTRVLQTAAGKMMFARKTKTSGQTRGEGRLDAAKTSGQTRGAAEGHTSRTVVEKIRSRASAPGSRRSSNNDGRERTGGRAQTNDSVQQNSPSQESSDIKVQAMDSDLHRGSTQARIDNVSRPVLRNNSVKPRSPRRTPKNSEDNLVNLANK